MALVSDLYEKQLHILDQKSLFNFVKMEYWELLSIYYISRMKL